MGLFLTSLGAPAFAAPSNDEPMLQEFLRLSPGVTSEEARTAIDNYANEQGITFDEALSEALTGARKSAAETNVAPGRLSSRSGGGDNVGLGIAARKGDIFYSPASTLFINHGHTGIWYSQTTIVHAPGNGEKSRSELSARVKVGKGTVKQYVDTTQAKRNASGNYAYNNLRSRNYNNMFFANKTKNGNLNCSQLVWVAYKEGAGIDLDSNGGPGVYPLDIKNSPSTKTYETL